MRSPWVGAFRERILEAWAEMGENRGRSVLRAIGVVLGVAAVLGGLSISDSMRSQSMRLFTRMGGLDKLNVKPSPLLREGAPSALQAGNLGLRAEDVARGEALDPGAVAGASASRRVQARVASPHADQERTVTGITADFIPMEGFALALGRAFTALEQERGEAVAVLGAEAAQTCFPSGDALGRTLVVGGIPVSVVGIFQERVFRLQEGGANVFSGANRIVALPASFVQRRLEADPHLRLDLMTFRLPDLLGIPVFSRKLSSQLRASHRQQEDFRLDDLAAKVDKAMKEGAVYDLVFILSGILSLLGSGIVNVNIQLASLQDRVQEVGLRMALGATRGEVFKGFVTEALLITVLGALVGLLLGVLFSWVIARMIRMPFTLGATSFLWAFLLATVFGFAFALYPAWRACRLSPMEALRYE